jgi:hypothetical protein
VAHEHDRLLDAGAGEQPVEFVSELARTRRPHAGRARVAEPDPGPVVAADEGHRPEVMEQSVEGGQIAPEARAEQDGG